MCRRVPDLDWNRWSLRTLMHIWVERAIWAVQQPVVGFLVSYLVWCAKTAGTSQYWLVIPTKTDRKRKVQTHWHEQTPTQPFFPVSAKICNLSRPVPGPTRLIFVGNEAASRWRTLLYIFAVTDAALSATLIVLLIVIWRFVQGPTNLVVCRLLKVWPELLEYLLTFIKITGDPWCFTVPRARCSLRSWVFVIAE